ncbi:MAG: hydrogenase maturation nickel metallochaperone HypA [Mariprofundaceae bacterium]|nr:hydrogenase maturation nickel metallochaperone HypA [Mariprofundaceae bacterium]
MHEISLCESIIETVCKEATLERFCRVKSIRLEIGRLSCVNPEAMFFAFNAVAKDTIADGAVLFIDAIPAKAWCKHCDADVEIMQRYDACPHCEYYPLEIKQGDAMRIKDMEVE